MATVTPTDITTMFPELAAATNAQLVAAITRAYARMDPGVWEKWLDEGALYLAAHLAAVAQASFRGGMVQSERLGPAAKTYAVPIPSAYADPLASTKYGREFAALREILPGARLGIATAAAPSVL